jgi:hypothetical protein
VEVIRHQSIGQHAYGGGNTRLRHQVEESVVIVGPVEHGAP